MSEYQVCAREGCDVEFIPRVHNMIFHSDECTKIETNRRIMKKYYENKERLSGKVRWCSECGETKLSRYNEGNVCASCTQRKVKESREELMALMSGIM